MEYCNDANYFEEKIEGVSNNLLYKICFEMAFIHGISIINYLSKVLRHYVIKT